MLRRNHSRVERIIARLPVQGVGSVFDLIILKIGGLVLVLISHHPTLALAGMPRLTRRQRLGGTAS